MGFYVFGPDVQVYDSVFQTTSTTAWPVTNLSFGQAFGDGGIVAGNTFINTNSTTVFGNSQNLIIENNEAYSEQGPGNFGGMGVWLPRGIANYSPSHGERNIYVGYNSFHDIGWPGQQIITTDGGAGAYFGYVAESTDNTVTLANDPSWVWTGTSNPRLATIAIISGTGVGQYSQIRDKVSGRTVTVVSPWTISPDSSSVVAITSPQWNLTISHNTFTDTIGATIWESGTVNAAIEDNVLTDSGEGLAIWAFGPYGGPADFQTTFDTDILRNTINVGSEKWFTGSIDNNVGGIGVFDNPGCAISGLLIRGNSVPYEQTMFSSNGLNGLNVTVIENNHANVTHMPAPWFLVQGNQPVAPTGN